MKAIISIVFLSFISLQLNAQTSSIKLLTKTKETFLKVIDSNATIYIDNAEVIKILKKAAKENGQDYSVMLKKLKGVCFSAVNLNKQIDDKEITMLQGLLKSEILVRALVAGKASIVPNGSTQNLAKVNFQSNLLNTINGLRQFDGVFTDENGKVLFSGTKTIK